MGTAHAPNSKIFVSVLKLVVVCSINNGGKINDVKLIIEILKHEIKIKFESFCSYCIFLKTS